MLVTALAIAALGPSYRQVFPLPSLTVPDGWGVNIHFTDPLPGELEKLSRAFHWVRMDFAWQGIEREKGKYDFSAFDRLLSGLDKNHLRPLWILDYGNPLYVPGAPTTPESRSAFANFVAAAVKHFRHRGVVWEMWNEPNIGFWSPKPNVAEYIALATQVGQTIRKVAPDEWYIGPATSGIDFNFLKPCFEAGLLKFWDAVSVHPYRQSEPESVKADWKALRSLVARFQPAGRTVGLISGEWGYSTAWNGIDETRQANYIVRQYMANLAAGVPLSIFYDWKEDGTDPKEPEHHFGINRPDFSQSKPAFESAAKIAGQLKGYHWVANAITGPVFSNGASAVAVFREREALRMMPANDPVGLALSKAGPMPSFPVLQSPADKLKFAEVLFRWLGQLPAQSPISLRNKPIRSSAELATALTGSPYSGATDYVKVGEWLLEVDQLAGQPIHVEVVPAPTGFEVTLKNETGLPLHGEVREKDQQFPFSFRAGEKQKSLVIPRGRFSVLDHAGTVIETWRYSMGPLPLDAGDLVATTDGDAKVSGTASVSKGSTIHFNYALSPGWRFAELKLKSRPTPSIGNAGVTLLLRVKGDGSGAHLRMRFSDSAGQVFQPEAGPLNFTDWRWMRFHLDDPQMGHWGGANDGVVRGTIRIETLALVDPAGQAGARGEIEISDAVVVSPGF